jgi:hypothetical protein
MRRAGSPAIAASRGIAFARPDDRADRSADPDRGEGSLAKPFQDRAAGRFIRELFCDAIEARTVHWATFPEQCAGFSSIKKPR